MSPSWKFIPLEPCPLKVIEIELLILVHGVFGGVHFDTVGAQALYQNDLLVESGLNLNLKSCFPFAKYFSLL